MPQPTLETTPAAEHAPAASAVGSQARWFWIALICFLPLHVSAVALDDWFLLPPKPIGDGPDYEAIGYGLSQGLGWSTAFSDPQWRDVYENSQRSNVGLDYSVQLARRGPIVPDTNRPPLFPLCIAMVYQIVPRGSIAFGIIRVAMASCLSLGCAIAVAWGVSLAKASDDARCNARDEGRSSLFQNFIGITSIAIVYSERNLRNYTTDFLTEPLALLLTQAFLFVAWYGTKRGNWQWAVFSGGMFSGMYFCRSVFVLWIPFVLVWLWYAYRITIPDAEVRRLAPARWTFLCMLAFCVISSMWWVRNCCVLGTFHPLGTKGSTTLMGGYCDAAYLAGGEWQFAPEKELRKSLESRIDLDEASAKDILDLEMDMGKRADAQVKRWISENLDLIPRLFVERIITEWNPYWGKALVLKLFAVIGVIWLACCNRVALVWLAGPLAINTLLVAVTYSVGGRFMVPTYGCLYILAAFGFSFILSCSIRSLDPFED